MIKATCPKNSKHDRFSTSVHAKCDFVVDEHGNIKELAEVLEATTDPDPNNLWFC